MKRFKTALIALLMVGVAACDSLNDLTELEVPNENNPDRERVLAAAGDIEGVIGSSLLLWWLDVEDTDPAWALSTAADEGSMSWGNFGMRQLASEPRVAWPNDPSFSFSLMTESAWRGAYGALSAINDGLRSIANDPEAAAQIDVTRATAFAKLVQGMSHGFLSMMYDSAFIFDETVDVNTDVLVLKPYPDVVAAAVSELNEAISLAAGKSFTTPDAWFDGNPLTADKLARLAHSYAARLMTQVARTPVERAATAAYWNTVIGHVDAGINSDIMIVSNENRFWKALDWAGYQVDNGTWARGDYKHIGWTDTGGGFANWLATPVASRNEFLITTADRRLTAAGDPQGDGTDWKFMGASQFPSARGTYYYSFYGGSRFKEYPESDFTAPVRWMTTVEMQLIKAEGLLRTTGPSQTVADIINATRVTRGKDLTPALAIESQSALMDKLIYEKRMETYLLCSGCAYFDRRGWGPLAPTGPNFHHGLVEGTPLHYAVPGKELQVLEKPLYTYGGVGNEGGTLQPSGSPGLRISSGDGVPASLVYRSPAQRSTKAGFSAGAAALNGLRYQ